MQPIRLFAMTGDAVAHLDSLDNQLLQTTTVPRNEHQSREGHSVNGVMCVAVDALSGRYLPALVFRRPTKPDERALIV